MGTLVVQDMMTATEIRDRKAGFALLPVFCGPLAVLPLHFWPLRRRLGPSGLFSRLVSGPFALGMPRFFTFCSYSAST